MKKIYFITILMIALIVQINAQTWTTVTTPSTSGVNHMLVANNKLYLATLGGVFSSTDGISWDSSSTGMTTIAMGYYYVENIYNYNNVLYSATGGSKLYKSVDYGANWTEIPGVKEPFTSPTFTAVFVKGDTMIVGLNKSLGFRKSYDGGTTWTRTAISEVIDKNIIELNGAIFVKTQKGIFKSTDMATSFTQLTGGLPTYSGSIGALTESNGVLICTIYMLGSTYISSDYGVTWTQTPTAIAAGRGLHAEGGNVYLGCAGQVYSSSNDGTTWTDITGTGIGPLEQITNFAVFQGDLYAGTGTALYKTPISTSINEIQAKSSYSVYPNPANEQLSISFDLKNSEVNSISLTDLNGRIVMHEIIQANQQQITVSVSDLENGIYLLYTDNGMLASRKIVVNH